MSEWIKQLFVSIFGSHSEIATFLISMIPIVELRGAIPFGSATALWGENALSLWASFGVSVLGSTLVCVVLTFLFWPIFKWLKKTKMFKKLADFVERKLNKNSESIDKKTKDEKNEKRVLKLKLIGIFAFVAIPLPLTGVWTGTCLALFVGLNKCQTMLSVISGNVVAGLLMTLVSYFFADNTMIVFLAFLILVALFVVYEIIKSLIQKHKKKKMEVDFEVKESEGVEGEKDEDEKHEPNTNDEKEQLESEKEQENLGETKKVESQIIEKIEKDDK